MSRSNIIPGLRKAFVVSTEDFQERGTIRINVPGIMSANQWEEANVMTPFGGLPNMGMTALPPVGAVGYVMYESDLDTIPVWVGGVLRSRYNTRTELEEGWANPVETEDPSDFVIKTQYTKAGEAGGEDVDSEENKVESIVKLNEQQVTIAKLRQDAEEYSYHKEAYSLQDDPYNMLTLEDTQIKLRFKFADNSKANEIIVNEESAGMFFDTDEGTMSIQAKEDTIEISGGGTNIILNKNGDVEINTSGKIKLNGDNNTAVLYEPLRDFINNVYNSHNHGSPAGPTSPPQSRYTQSKSMKSQSVKLS